MLPGVIFSIFYTSSKRTRLTTYRLPGPLTSLLTRLLSPLVDPSNSAPPRRADRVLPGEISESAQQARSRLLLLERQVAQAQRASVTREVEGAMERRRNVGRALEALQERLASQTAGQEPTQGVQATEPVPPPRRSRFGLGGWVDRAGEAVGLRTESPAVTGAGTAETPLEPVVQPRAPTQQEIDTIVGMFPNLSRDAVVRALQTRSVRFADWWPLLMFLVLVITIQRWQSRCF